MLTTHHSYDSYTGWRPGQHRSLPTTATTAATATTPTTTPTASTAARWGPACVNVSPPVARPLFDDSPPDVLCAIRDAETKRTEDAAGNSESERKDSKGVLEDLSSRFSLDTEIQKRIQEAWPVIAREASRAISRCRTQVRNPSAYLERVLRSCDQKNRTEEQWIQHERDRDRGLHAVDGDSQEEYDDEQEEGAHDICSEEDEDEAHDNGLHEKDEQTAAGHDDGLHEEDEKDEEEEEDETHDHDDGLFQDAEGQEDSNDDSSHAGGDAGSESSYASYASTAALSR